MHSFPTFAITQHHELGAKEQTFILSHWRPEVQKQGVGMAVLSLTALQKSVSLLLMFPGSSWRSLAYRYIIPVTWPSACSLCVYTLSSLCMPMSLSKLPISMEASHIGLMTSL